MHLALQPRNRGFLLLNFGQAALDEDLLLDLEGQVVEDHCLFSLLAVFLHYGFSLFRALLVDSPRLRKLLLILLQTLQLRAYTLEHLLTACLELRLIFLLLSLKLWEMLAESHLQTMTHEVKVVSEVV